MVRIARVSCAEEKQKASARETKSRRDIAQLSDAYPTSRAYRRDAIVAPASYRTVTRRSLAQFRTMPLFTLAYYVTRRRDMLYVRRVYDITLARRKITLRLCCVTGIA